MGKGKKWADPSTDTRGAKAKAQKAEAQRETAAKAQREEISARQAQRRAFSALVDATPQIRFGQVGPVDEARLRGAVEAARAAGVEGDAISAAERALALASGAAASTVKSDDPRQVRRSHAGSHKGVHEGSHHR